VRVDGRERVVGAEQDRVDVVVSVGGGEEPVVPGVQVHPRSTAASATP
jgi:hypothetical protein